MAGEAAAGPHTACGKSSFALSFSRTQKVIILLLWIASDVLVIHQRA